MKMEPYFYCVLPLVFGGGKKSLRVSSRVGVVVVGAATSDVVCSVRNCPPFHSCVAEFVQASCIVDSPWRNICPRGMMVMPDCLWMHNPSEITAAVHMRWTRCKLRQFPSPPLSHLFIPPPPPPPSRPLLPNANKGLSDITYTCLLSLSAYCSANVCILERFATYCNIAKLKRLFQCVILYIYIHTHGGAVRSQAHVMYCPCRHEPLLLHPPSHRTFLDHARSLLGMICSSSPPPPPSS